MLKRLSRRKPTSVMPKRRAASTARLEGAETAQITGMPAIAAFCTISKLALPDTSSTRAGERQIACQEPLADDLVDRVVPADVLAQREQLAVARKQRRAVQPTGAFEHLLGSPQRVRQRQHHLGLEHRAVGDTLSVGLDHVQ